jgi:hypothetical protein
VFRKRRLVVDALAGSNLERVTPCVDHLHDTDQLLLLLSHCVPGLQTVISEYTVSISYKRDGSWMVYYHGALQGAAAALIGAFAGLQGPMYISALTGQA